MNEKVKIVLSSIWSWVSSRELLVYLTFVVLATLVWYGHALTSVRNARVEVRVDYTDIPDRINFETPLPTSINMEIRDAGRRLIVYRREQMHITLSLDGQFQNKKGEVHISEDILRRTLSGLLQGTTHLQLITPEDIHAHYYTEQERVIPVALNATYTCDPEYIMTSDPQLANEQICIYGNIETLRSIMAIETEKRVIENIRDTVRETFRLIIPDGVRAEMDSVEVIFPTVRFTEKILTVPVHATGVPEDQTLRIFPQTVTVIARVDVTHFSSITAGDFHARCQYPRAGQQELPVTISYHSPYIFGARVTPSNLEFIIEQ